MEKKKKMLLLTLFGIITIAIAAMLIHIITGISGKESDTPVKVELPDAATNDIPRAKIKAYESGRTVKSYDAYLADLSSGATDTTAADESVINAQETMRQQQQAVERITTKLQEKVSDGTRNEKKKKVTAKPVPSSTSKGISDTSGKEEWQERYDYLLEKLYGKEESTDKQQSEQKPETIQSQAPETGTSTGGFITVVGGGITTHNPIKAATTTETKICAGDKVQLRLLQETPTGTGNMILPKNTYVYAIAKIDDNRLQLYISSINYNGKVLPVNWAAYDTDGYKGLAYTVDETSEQITDEAVSAATNMVGQLASMANRTAGTIIRSTSRMGNRAAKEKQQVITLPKDYQIYLQ
ncbi:MAG: conjugative transposon protein TraM [Bacteroidales bacterium]|nr:conjugative transposon protein TraM [Bacteroidales bacterium]